jgi:DNA-binding NarL/FixJ family response regulator
MKPYKILLADDHVLFREAVKRSLKEVDWLDVIGEVSDGQELLNFLTRATPDLIVLDISMPRIQGLEAAEQIKAQYPDIKILILTMHKSGEYLRRALKTGIEGYLLKENALSDMVAAIDAVRRSEVYVSSLLSGKVMREHLGVGAAGESLTAREMQVLKLVAGGKSSKEIAELLEIRIMTVFNHRVHIKNKLQIKRNAELIKFAIENGYV